MTHSQAYQILGIPHSSNIDEIKKAYKKLTKKYHPDIFEGDKKFAEEKMKQINGAYSLLSSSYSPNSIDDEFEQAYEQSRRAKQAWQEYEEQRRNVYENLKRMQKEMEESNRQWKKRLKIYCITVFTVIEFTFAMLLAFMIKMILYYFNGGFHFMFAYSICSAVFILLLMICSLFLFMRLMKKAKIFK